MTQNFSFLDALAKSSFDFHPVVPLDVNKQKVAVLDLSKSNKEITPEVYESTESLAAFIDQKMAGSKATYLVGGYNEMREMYRRSSLFDKNLVGVLEEQEEPRSLHLGVDIWGPVDTKIYAPLGGMVHSFAFNGNHGDYGATIILQHQVDMFNFYTLYGHLALKDLGNIRSGQFITRGENFAHFGPPEENGNWPPHLHFQVITDMGQFEGDFPGVCKPSEAGYYLSVCPNPNLILNLDASP
ncbi:MAG: peptidoglycan DD-metalloendopeptidase family protein [Gloeobacteraceae cyanobacterium ES-bin-316]|nr:peptidoglycan DD-metalloendopeptidase family protein [Ferruginibacter sp.]